MILHYLSLAIFFSIGPIHFLIAADNILSKLDLLRYDKVCLSSLVTSPPARRRMLEMCQVSPGVHHTRDKPHSAIPGQQENK